MPLPLSRGPARLAHLPSKPRDVGAICPELRAAIRRAVAGESRWPLVVVGPPGCGKTCAGLCLLDYAGGLYFTASGLAEAAILAAKWQLLNEEGRSVSSASLWQEISRTALVVLDELGAREQVGDWHYEQVKRVLDDRDGRPLVVLTNLEVAGVARLYDDRLASRLSAGTVVILDGPDRRLSPPG